MRLQIYSTPDALSAAITVEVGDRVRQEPGLVLGLPTGRTPEPLYEALVAECRAGRISFSRSRAFLLDELLGLSREDPASFRGQLTRQLFSRTDHADGGIDSLDGLAPDPDTECARYDRAIAEAGGIDLLLLGIGSNGHIAFNEPADALAVGAHRVALAAGTRATLAEQFDGRLERVPREALTLGMGALLRARRVLVMATGHGKADVVARLAARRITTRLPASLLHLHRDARLAIDRAAAARLPPDVIRSGAVQW